MEQDRLEGREENKAVESEKAVEGDSEFRTFAPPGHAAADGGCVLGCISHSCGAWTVYGELRVMGGAPKALHAASVGDG